MALLPVLFPAHGSSSEFWCLFMTPSFFFPVPSLPWKSCLATGSYPRDTSSQRRKRLFHTVDGLSLMTSWWAQLWGGLVLPRSGFFSLSFFVPRAARCGLSLSTLACLLVLSLLSSCLDSHVGENMGCGREMTQQPMAFYALIRKQYRK